MGTYFWWLLLAGILAPFAAMLGQYLGLRKLGNLPSRYVVGIPSKKIVYKGESRTLAWLFWAVSTKRGGEAYDRYAVMTTPKNWITPKDISLEYFTPE